jgi:hypothetical protein
LLVAFEAKRRPGRRDPVEDLAKQADQPILPMRQFDRWRPNDRAFNHQPLFSRLEPAMSKTLYSFFGAILGSGIFLLAGREPLQKLINSFKNGN